MVAVEQNLLHQLNSAIVCYVDHVKNYGRKAVVRHAEDILDEMFFFRLET